MAKIVVPIGSRFLADPATFLFDLFHENVANVTPIHMGRVAEVSTNLFPALLPLGELNVAAKARAHREHGLWPQIDARGAYWTSLPALVAGGSLDAKPDFFGYNAGVTVSESLDPRLRVFAGYEYSAMRFDLVGLHKLSGSGDSTSATGLNSSDVFGSAVPDAFHVGKTEHYLIIGSELLRTPVKRLSSYIGYGLTSNRFVLRLTWESRFFNTGLAFYPDGTLILSPLMNFQVRF